MDKSLFTMLSGRWRELAAATK